MNYLNLSIESLTCHAFIDATPPERGTWLCLMRYCAQQETGGVIEGAREWKDRKWQQICAITMDEARAECGLWTWVGDDLHVAMYPARQEDEVRRKREAGRQYGRGQAKKVSPLHPPSKNKNKKEEGKGKEGGAIAELYSSPHSSANSSAILPATATPDWVVSQYIEAFYTIRPEFIGIPAVMIGRALQCQSDQRLRAEAFNSFALSVMQRVNAPDEPAALLTGYMRNADQHDSTRPKWDPALDRKF